MWENLSSYYMRQMFTFNGILDCVIYILSLAILFYDRKLFENDKINFKNVLILIAEIAGMYAALLLVGGLLRIMSDSYIVLNYVSKLVVMVVYVIFFNNYKWQSKVILGSLIYALFFCFAETSGCLKGLLDAKERHAYTEYVRSVMTLMSMGAAVFLRYYNVDKCPKVSVNAVVEMGILSCVGVVLSILRAVFIISFAQFELTEQYVYSFNIHLFIMITLLCIIFLIIVCYFLLVNNIKTNESNIELNNKLLRLETVENMVAVNESNLRQLHKVKHEIKNRFSIMRGMLRDKKYAELEKYFEEITGDAVVPLMRVNTGNDSFDRVFNLEISKAAAKKIEVATKLIVPPELPVSEADLGGLIANLMDNAIEACEKIEDGERLIDVDVKVVHSYLVISISNSLTEENAKTALLLETDKPNKNLHGFGTEIIDGIVDKYNGQILRRVENGRFTADVMLDISGIGGDTNEES